ncbi:hypothetical protein Lal_00010244, partial [Lupinus albus]
PISVISVIDKIQRLFLWDSGEERKCIHWLKWTKVCMPKENVTLDKDATVESFGAWSNEEEEDYDDFLKLIHNSKPKQHTADTWTWIEQYSVSNAYQILQKEEQSRDLVFFKRLWASNVPTEMKYLGMMMYVHNHLCWDLHVAVPVAVMVLREKCKWLPYLSSLTYKRERVSPRRNSLNPID